jgi:hypothetical protein
VTNAPAPRNAPNAAGDRARARTWFAPRPPSASAGGIPKLDPRGSRATPNANLAGRDDAERADQFRRPVPAYLTNNLRFRRVPQARKAKQDHPGVYEALPEDQLAEVLVRSQQNRPPCVGLPQDLLIGNAGGQLSHADDAMAILA